MVKLQNRSMATAQNVIGAQVRRLRNQRDFTQEQLAARLQVLGLEISRAGLSKIEAGLRCVADAELPFIAEALNVGIGDLFPTKLAKKRGGTVSR
jgi:transcriptional regulator with XRE-family HTH domain